VAVRVRQANVDDTTGVIVRVGEETGAVHDPDPAVLWKVVGVVGRVHAADGRVHGRAERNQVGVEARCCVTEGTQQGRQEDALLHVKDAELAEELHILTPFMVRDLVLHGAQTKKPRICRRT